jgi:hypothetical protein
MIRFFGLGIKSKLPYLKNLGVTALWIGPICPLIEIIPINFAAQTAQVASHSRAHANGAIPSNTLPNNILPNC